MTTQPTVNDARRRLAASRVLVVGVGALGCPAILHLADAGIGTLVLIDPDRIEASNLPRQILHGSAGVGTLKVDSAADFLARRFPAVRVERHPVALDAANLPELFRAADFIVDATDGATAKFLINDGAVRWQRPFSHAGVLGFLGQTLTVLPGRSACYRCLFPEPPPAGEVASCQEAGVVGAIAGVIAAVQAAETVKYLTGDGELLADRLLTVDGLSGAWRHVRLARNPRCPVCTETQPPADSPLAAKQRAGYGGMDR